MYLTYKKVFFPVNSQRDTLSLSKGCTAILILQFFLTLLVSQYSDQRVPAEKCEKQNSDDLHSFFSSLGFCHILLQAFFL